MLDQFLRPAVVAIVATSAVYVVAPAAASSASCHMPNSETSMTDASAAGLSCTEPHPASRSTSRYIAKSVGKLQHIEASGAGGCVASDGVRGYMDNCNRRGTDWSWRDLNNWYGEFQNVDFPNVCLGVDPNSNPGNPSVGAWWCGTENSDKTSVWLIQYGSGYPAEASLYNQFAMNQGRDSWPMQKLGSRPNEGLRMDRWNENEQSFWWWGVDPQRLKPAKQPAAADR
ncbi:MULTISPECIES: hypothetical protein [Amycolatopsis]|uniref:Secreted protein n=1 Tax=Amycolatopsis albidoflavus TaxID=102226 RepID=A0ABW5HXF3_9PSEU